MTLRRIHHVAYRCRDAKQTVEFYRATLGMDFTLAIAEDVVPSTGDPDPYMHVFLDAGGGNVLAFFELPDSPEMGRDPNTPEWVQHIAFEIGSWDELLATKALEYLDALAADAGDDTALRRELADAYMQVGAILGAVVGATSRRGLGLGGMLRGAAIGGV